MEIQRRLDHILNYLKDADNLEGKHFSEILKELDEDENTELKIEIHPIIEKLERDNFIYEIDNNESYRLTIDGKLIAGKDYYQNKAKFDKLKDDTDEIIRKLTLDSLKDAHKIFNKGMIRTIIAGIIGLIAGALLSGNLSKEKLKCHKQTQQTQHHHHTCQD